MLTGQYAHNHGVLSNAQRNGGYRALDHGNTLPVWLQLAGVKTGLRNRLQRQRTCAGTTCRRGT